MFSGATLDSAAGKLVATEPLGLRQGQGPEQVPRRRAPATASFAKRFEVADNQTVAPTALTHDPRRRHVHASCTDENAAAGVGEPALGLSRSSTSPATSANFARRVGNGEGTVSAGWPTAPGVSVTSRGSNQRSRWHLQTVAGEHLLVDGIVRQDGAGSPAALCTVIGTVLRVG